ncbi:hypothetical protein [Halorubrum sp. DTA98]|uniref:hypothetical protein n=1 Tax=Halorubrum sp. DTA98 TaxID=3402163 RepID=UPI003AAF003D
MSGDGSLSNELRDRLSRRRGDDDDQSKFEVSETETYVGDTVTLTGRDLDANEIYEVIWHSAIGSWGVLGGNEVVGPQFKPRSESIATVTTDSAGRFSEEWTVKEDYGGEHRIELRTIDGVPQARTKVTIKPWFEIDRTSAPVGETFTVTGYGLGPNMITNNYQLAWDNGMVGFMTGTLNRGTATADIRAIDEPGEHVIQVWRNLRGVPFLQNNTQSPFGPVGDERQSSWTVEVTELESEPETTWMDSLEDETPLTAHYPELDEATDATLEITPTSGQPGTEATIVGREFPADTEVDLIWYTHVGNRVAGNPITPEPLPDLLPSVTTDEDGAFEIDVTIPRGMGATRPITAAVDGHEVAVTGFVMQPDIVDVSPQKGPVGTDIEIELTGIGWPTYENAYFFVYDNRPLGYVCGVDMEKHGEGIVRTIIQATGEPGYHFIDVYPSFFETQEDLPDFEQKAHLSYRENHPVRSLPALHFTFEVTE